MKEIVNNFEEDIRINGPVEIRNEALQKFREVVEEYYVNNNVDADLIEQLAKHNQQVEDFVRDYSGEDKESFDVKEREIAILAAIFHDITKVSGDFLDHGKDGGRIAEKILQENGVSFELAHSVSLAIERHMGGEEGYPGRMAKKEFGKKFKYPIYKTRVAQMVYECDILTQLTPEGFEKILLLRENDEENRIEDEKVAEEKRITRKEASILSALQSAKESLSFIKMKFIEEDANKFWDEMQKKYRDLIEK
ncbi:MAG: HD domain-containing protein [Candidatus Pacebacteria bacterium]|nr:HD domain-containing protein [Candidatus Paceibacterota bacterium]